MLLFVSSIQTQGKIFKQIDGTQGHFILLFCQFLVYYRFYFVYTTARTCCFAKLFSATFFFPYHHWSLQDGELMRVEKTKERLILLFSEYCLNQALPHLQQRRDSFLLSEARVFSSAQCSNFQHHCSHGKIIYSALLFPRFNNVYGYSLGL